MTRNICIVQARINSNRLPGKVLKRLAGRYVIDHVLTRCQAIDNIDKVVCAIPHNTINNVLANKVSKMGFDCFRGPEQDVLARYYYAAQKYSADNIIRITSDCPLIDPQIASALITRFQDCDYASNNYSHNKLIKTGQWPIGLNVEIISFAWLKKAFQQAILSEDREHVTPFCIYNHQCKKKILAGPGGITQNWRWTLDTEQDLQLMHKLFQYLQPQNYSWLAPRNIMLKYPELTKINT